MQRMHIGWRLLSTYKATKNSILIFQPLSRIHMGKRSWTRYAMSVPSEWNQQHDVMQNDKYNGSATNCYRLWPNPRMSTYTSWMRLVRTIGWDYGMKNPCWYERVDLDTWETNVRLPAIQVAEGNTLDISKQRCHYWWWSIMIAFHKNESMPDPLSLSSIASTMLSPSSSRLEYVLFSILSSWSMLIMDCVQ